MARCKVGSGPEAWPSVGTKLRRLGVTGPWLHLLTSLALREYLPSKVLSLSHAELVGHICMSPAKLLNTFSKQATIRVSAGGHSEVLGSSSRHAPVCVKQRGVGPPPPPHNWQAFRHTGE